MDYTKHIFAGAPVDFEVIDVHVHHGANPGYYPGPAGGDDIVHAMGRLGVDICCCTPGATASDFDYFNEQLAKSLDKHPHKLRGYVMITPHDAADPDRWFKRSPGFIGLKSIPFCQGEVSIDDPRLWDYYAYADRRGLPVLVHTWAAPEVEATTRMAEKYPNARFIVAHAALTGSAAKQALIDGMKQCENMACDTAISDTYDGALEWFVDKVGADRVLYGSDFITFECSHILGRVAMSKLTDDEKEKIFSRNARQWLRL
ncbi:MAG: amidohydrolase [Oscillospiraceae bacterium]|nr:amidohydrolase [Oscillospiraceae bacterium]